MVNVLVHGRIKSCGCWQWKWPSPFRAAHRLVWSFDPRKQPR